MNAPALVVLVLLVIAQLALPRKWATLPLILGACYMTKAARIDIGPMSFTFTRILVIFAFLRIVTRGEGIKGGIVLLDKIVIAWTSWYLFASLFTIDPSGTLIFRLGNISDTAGIYLPIRCFCQSREDVLNSIKITAIVLVPLSIEMIIEQRQGFNYFSFFGANPNVNFRDGSYRASGPFLHAILAGTIGGTCFPLMFCIYKTNRKTAIAGMTACAVIVFASKSSGPLMALIFSLFFMYLWRRKWTIPYIKTCVVIVYIFLELAWDRPAYYILGRIDLTGSSTGFHRARLIESAFEHLGEWWFAGTEYTRHWMATGVSYSENHTDITNHYIGQGVSGGLPQMLLYIACIFFTFKNLKFAYVNGGDTGTQLIVWALGASLLSHAASQISVYYFDQSVLFIYLVLAVGASFHKIVQEEVLSNQQADTSNPA